jgi:hypothetical protein
MKVAPAPVISAATWSPAACAPGASAAGLAAVGDCSPPLQAASAKVVASAMAVRRTMRFMRRLRCRCRHEMMFS